MYVIISSIEVVAVRISHRRYKDIVRQCVEKFSINAPKLGFAPSLSPEKVRALLDNNVKAIRFCEESGMPTFAPVFYNAPSRELFIIGDYNRETARLTAEDPITITTALTHAFYSVGRVTAVQEGMFARVAVDTVQSTKNAPYSAYTNREEPLMIAERFPEFKCPTQALMCLSDSMNSAAGERPIDVIHGMERCGDYAALSLALERVNEYRDKPEKILRQMTRDARYNYGDLCKQYLGMTPDWFVESFTNRVQNAGMQRSIAGEFSASFEKTVGLQRSQNTDVSRRQWTGTIQSRLQSLRANRTTAVGRPMVAGVGLGM